MFIDEAKVPSALPPNYFLVRGEIVDIFVRFDPIFYRAGCLFYGACFSLFFFSFST